MYRRTQLSLWTHQKCFYMWYNHHWKLAKESRKTSAQPRLSERYTENQEGGRGANWSGWDWCPRRGLRGKGRLHGQRCSLRMECLEPLIGSPSPGSKPGRMRHLGWLAGTNGGLSEAWTSLVRSTCACPLVPEADWRAQTEGSIPIY